jgi:hypothetical protein
MNELKCNREGNLLYTLQHCGWRKDEELFKNLITIKFEFDGVSILEQEEIINRVRKIINEYFG